MSYIDNSDCTANIYSMRQCTFKWTTILVFHFLDLAVLKSGFCYLHLGLNINTELLLVRNLIEEAGKSKITPPPDWLGDQVQLQQMMSVS